MNKIFTALIAAFLTLTTGAFASAEEPTKTRKEMVDEKAQNPDEYKLLLELKDGVVEIELLPVAAPNHVARIKELARQGFYDGIVFHRVIEGFMAQTGDPTGTGMGGSGKNLKAEFSAEKHTRGTLSMARAASPDSADSQFFIVFDDASFLDNQYTVWGRVTKGMELVDRIKKGDSANEGKVTNPDKIISMKVAADAKVAAAPAKKAAKK